MAELTPELSIERIADLSEADLECGRLLTQTVYPPEIWADWPGYRLEWSPKDWCIRTWDANGRLTSNVSIVVRMGIADGGVVRVGGIGGVMTHPDHRKKGLATASLRKTIEFFREAGDIDFALLVCEPMMLDFYAGFGFREFVGKTWVRQHGAKVEFTFLRVMTLGIQSTGPIEGVIDLCSPPW